jgi:transposase
MSQQKSLFVAMELSNKNWKLAFGDGSTTRERSLTARDEALLLREVAAAKTKLHLPEETPVIFCYEAGRDGFWIARMLNKHGYECDIMDPASIEVPRQARQRKTDRLDAVKLLDLLIRSRLWGQRKAYSVVRVPTEAQEAALRLHRERQRLVKEQTGHLARIKSLVVLHGREIKNPARLAVESLRDWAGNPLGEAWVGELKREQQRLVMVQEQIQALEDQQTQAMKQMSTPAEEKAKKLFKLKAVGTQGSWVLSHECFGWRRFQNRRQLGSFAGLTGTPYDSGDTLREQGISKAGSGRVRYTLIELAWSWIRWQPNSALTHWFVDHYVRGGTSRSKRKGIVAVARKLLIALWKYVEQDVVPEGAILKA